MDRRLLCDIPDLPINAFKHVGDKRIKPEGGGGGKGGGGSTTTVQQSVPKELIPYVKESIDLGRELRETPYVPYQGQRIAGFTPEQKAVQQQVFGLQQPKQFDTAMAGAQGTGALGYGTAQTGLSRALGYNPGTFSSRDAAYYADPYQQNVTNIALREAQRSGAQAARDANLASAGRGTYGGARNALMQAELQRNLGTQLSDIQAKGSEAGFLNAQQQYERDRAAAAQAAGLGAQVGTSGLGTSLQSALGLGQLAGQSQEANLNRLNAQSTAAKQIQAQNQSIRDQQYQDFLNQRDYGKQQLAFYSDLIRGNAPLYGTVQSTRTPSPSLASQVAGLGAGAYGIGKLTGAFAEGGQVRNNYSNGLAGLSLYNLTK
jgi:hypothetical protein